MKLKFVTFLLLTLPFVVLFSFHKIDPNNPPAGRTGAPGETTCQASGCHSGGNYTGVVEIVGVPDTVLADSSYSITLTNTSNAVRAGFQLTVLDTLNKKLGTLIAGSGCSIANAGGRQYVRQSSPHTLANGSTSWTFTWKAPATVTGDSVHFYFTSLCANANGNDNGDNVLKNKKSVVLQQFVSDVNDKNGDFQLVFSPNPAKEFLNIEIEGKGFLKIFDLNGQAIKSMVVDHAANVNISNLLSGLYFSTIEMNGQAVTKTFVKE